jgi:uncharacterized protein YndB with AHSA1/START domain
MTTVQTSIEPITRTVSVNCSVEHAFETFTARIGSWWPVSRYSISVDEGGTNPPTEVIFEPRAGGRVYERSVAGEELAWAEVLAYEPPSRIVLAWNPSREERPRTEVEVRFIAEAGGTRVDLEHRGWERLGAMAEAARQGYGSPAGWTTVLGIYADAAST